MYQANRNNNMRLWDSVCKTDPSQTKGFSKSGGFKGTAIKPYWLIQQATATFGPIGLGWGWEELETQYIAGVWCSKVRIWYTLDGHRASIEQWGQTVMQGKNKNGEFVDEEAPKKAVTDAVTKCLSYIGFAGDVHMGLFDDSKYVEERQKEEAQVKKDETAKARNQRWEKIKQELEAAESLEDLQRVWTENGNHIKAFDAQLIANLERIKNDKKKELQADDALKAGMPQGFDGIPY